MFCTAAKYLVIIRIYKLQIMFRHVQKKHWPGSLHFSINVSKQPLDDCYLQCDSNALLAKKNPNDTAKEVNNK